MKKNRYLFITILLSAALLCTAFPVYAGAAEDSSAEIYAAYADLVIEKEAEYGAGTVQGEGQYYIDGVGFLHLTDLNGDGTDELILAVCEMFHAAVEIYTVFDGQVVLIYSGDALMRSMDIPLVEIWEDDMGNQYFPVNKGNYFDGVLSFLRFDGTKMTEAMTASLANPEGDTGLHRAASFELSFGSGDEEANRNWIDDASDKLFFMRDRLGLSPVSDEAEPMNDHTELLNSGSELAEKDVTLVDDDVLTIISHGKTMIRIENEDRPVYAVTITNHTANALELSDAHLTDDFIYECGTANGARIIAVDFFIPQDSESALYRDSEGMVFKTLPANSTMDFYMEIVCAGYGLRTTEELVRINANVHVSCGTGDTFWYRNYVLLLDQEETAPSLSTAITSYENPYFRFEIPEDWSYDVLVESDEYGIAHIYLPPAVNDHGFSQIVVQYDNWDTAQGNADYTTEFYLSDNASQGNYTVYSYDTEIGGRIMKTVEVIGKLSDSRFCFYYLDLPDGYTLTIETSVELAHEDELRDAYTAFLNSIQFKF